jgi:fatty acid synthase, animal type
VVSTADISTESGCKNLIEEAIKLGPVVGIFNLAVQLRDGFFENQTPEKFKESLAPKALATKYLDRISRELCPELQYFVVFSSIACGLGNEGQTNYGMANSMMERIIEERHNDGLPAKAIQWGPVGDVGIVAENDLSFSLLQIQPIASCIDVMDELLRNKKPILSSLIIESNLSAHKNESLLESMLRVLGIESVDSVSQSSTLSQLGLDSLMVVEIRQLLERDFGLFYNAEQIRDMTIQQVGEISKKNENEKLKNKIETPEEIQGFDEDPHVIN